MLSLHVFKPVVDFLKQKIFELLYFLVDFVPVMENNNGTPKPKSFGFGGTTVAAPLLFRPGNLALCGSCPLVTPY